MSMVVGRARPGLPALDNDAVALCRVPTAQLLVGFGGRQFDHHGQPLFGVVQLQIGDLGHLA
jgi:hypothetical protein